MGPISSTHRLRPSLFSPSVSHPVLVQSHAGIKRNIGLQAPPISSPDPKVTQSSVRCCATSYNAPKLLSSLVDLNRISSSFLQQLVYSFNTAKMPIVGPILTGSTATLGCVTSVIPLGGDNSRWWHPTVFVTSLSSYSSQGVPDLTTVYTYPPHCVDRWMLYPPREPCGDGPSSSGPQNFTVFSVDPTRLYPISDPLYRSCQRYSTPVYSPGICPGGHTIAEVTAYASEVTTGTDRTFWQASCCRRFSDSLNSSI
jgi:hypothetical protein